MHQGHKWKHLRKENRSHTDEVEDLDAIEIVDVAVDYHDHNSYYHPPLCCKAMVRATWWRRKIVAVILFRFAAAALAASDV